MPKSSVVVLVVCGWMHLVVSPAVAADGFAIRPVTNFGSPTLGSSATPLAVLNDHLLFLAEDGGIDGLYRTDGTQVELIDNSIMIPASAFDVANVESIQFGGELYFSAAGPDGRELYATDGNSVRQVANLAPGSLSSNPRNFQIMNGTLLFDAITQDPAAGSAPLRFFHTDGTMVGEFSLARRLESASSLGDRYVFNGFPPGGGAPGIYSTDGELLTTVSPQLPSNYSAALSTRVGDRAYFASEFQSGGIHRTDGLTSELVASYADFLPSLDFTPYSIFELDGVLHVELHDSTSREVSIFRSSGGTLEEVVRWQAPSFIATAALLEEPLYNDGERAYLRFAKSLDEDGLFVFDGANILPTTLETPWNDEWEFIEAGDRLFVKTRTPLEDSALWEIVGDEVTPVGPRFETVFSFAGEVFAAQLPPLPPSGVSSENALWQITEDPFVPLGSVIGGFGTGSGLEASFVEFNGQLYFNGTDGTNQQLYALVPVPEPSSTLPALTGLAFLCAIRHYTPRPKWSRRW